MDDFIDSVRDFYNEAGEYFSKTRQKSYGKKGDYNWPYISDELSKLKDGQRILDLGCGNGRLISGLPKGVSYVGVDFSDTLIQEAKKKFRGYKFIVGDITDRGIYKNQGKFDHIYCIATLHHIPTRELQLDVLKNAKSILKKNGRIIITVWNLVQVNFLKHHLKSLRLKTTNPRWLTVPFRNDKLRYCFAFDTKYMAELIQDAGFEIEKISYVDREGGKSNFAQGRNLLVIARQK